MTFYKGLALAYLIISCVTFLLYAKDKSAALDQRQRISEKTLHLFSLLGGWPGAWLAQRWLRHKNLKHRFQLLFHLSIAFNAVLLAGLLSLTTQVLQHI